MKLMDGFCVMCAAVNAHLSDCPTGQMIERDRRIAKLESDVSKLVKIIMDNRDKLDVRY